MVIRVCCGWCTENLQARHQSGRRDAGICTLLARSREITTVIWNTGEKNPFQTKQVRAGGSALTSTTGFDFRGSWKKAEGLAFWGI